MDFDQHVRKIPDFPKKGILFYDVTTVLQDAAAFKAAVDSFENWCDSKKIDVVVGIESRGFIFGGALAERVDAGFVPVRKPGKLPADVISATYHKEYGDDMLEVHKDAILPGQKVVVVDDLLATGGTAAAACELVERLGGEVIGICFLIELEGLAGRDKISKYPVYSILKYEGE